MSRLLLLSAVLLCSGCMVSIPKGIPGSGKITTVSAPVQGFARIRHTTVGSLTIIQGEEESVKITTDDNLQPYLEVVVEGDELILRNVGDEPLQPTKGIQITVTVVELKAVALTGVGNITASGIEGPSLEVSSSGVGAIQLAGKVEELSVQVDGVGSFDSTELDAKKAKVVSTGVGMTTVKATESIDIKATGVGGVIYYGAPQEKKIDARGIGSVRAGD